jgi:hypothetical protein
MQSGGMQRKVETMIYWFLENTVIAAKFMIRDIVFTAKYVIRDIVFTAKYV